MSNEITLKTIPKIEELSFIDLPDREPVTDPGIEETLDCVDFGIAFANAIVYAYQDGELTVTDFQYAMAPIMKVPAAFAGISKVPLELSNLDTEEKVKIVEIVKTKLDVSDEKAVRIVQKAVTLAIALYELVDEIKS